MLVSRRGFRPVVRKPDYTTAIDALSNWWVTCCAAARAAYATCYDSRVMFEAALARHAA